MIMMKALERLIDDMTQENCTTGVAKSINAMAAACAESTWYTPQEREFAELIYTKSGRAYKTFVPVMKQLLAEHRNKN